MTPSMIIRTVEKRVARISLNRPDRRNALNPQMISELIGAFSDFSKDPHIRLIHLRGEGEIFCTGADIGWMRSMADATEAENSADAIHLATLYDIIKTCPKPTLVTVQGGAYGGGVGLVAACDCAVALEQTLFSLSEVRIGVIPAIISPYLVQAMGSRHTRKLTLTGECFDAQEALRLGLVHHLAPSVEEMGTVVEDLTAQLLKGSPQAQGLAKKLFQDLEATTFPEEIRQMTITVLVQARASQDGKEGLKAFLEKRDPSWY